jgi:hypothetical protein
MSLVCEQSARKRGEKIGEILLCVRDFVTQICSRVMWYCYIARKNLTHALLNFPTAFKPVVRSANLLPQIKANLKTHFPLFKTIQFEAAKLIRYIGMHANYEAKIPRFINNKIFNDCSQLKHVGSQKYIHKSKQTKLFSTSKLWYLHNKIVRLEVISTNGLALY